MSEFERKVYEALRSLDGSVLHARMCEFVAPRVAAAIEAAGRTAMSMTPVEEGPSPSQEVEIQTLAKAAAIAALMEERP